MYFFKKLNLEAGFQSTLPIRRATTSVSESLLVILISIHAPHTESDQKWLHKYKQFFKFQSTLPIRRATKSFGSVRLIRIFQSTLPIRRATFNCVFRVSIQKISIHAPHTESDALIFGSTLPSAKFQSTLPIRRATQL